MTWMRRPNKNNRRKKKRLTQKRAKRNKNKLRPNELDWISVTSKKRYIRIETFDKTELQLETFQSNLNKINANARAKSSKITFESNAKDKAKFLGNGN